MDIYVTVPVYIFKNTIVIVAVGKWEVHGDMCAMESVSKSNLYVTMLYIYAWYMWCETGYEIFLRPIHT